MQFTLPLKEKGTQQRHTTTLHLMLAFLLVSIGAVCEALYWFTSVSPAFVDVGGAYRPFLLFGIACILCGGAILVLTIFQKQWIRRERNNLLFRILELVLIGGSSLLFYLNHWHLPAMLFGIMTGVILSAIIRERRAGGSGSQVVIDASGILLPGGTGRRTLGWAEVDQVLLRHGTLSIECTENRLVQRSVEALPFAPADLETFCREQIETHRAERIQNDW